MAGDERGGRRRTVSGRRRAAFLALSFAFAAALGLGVLEVALRVRDGAREPEQMLAMPEEWRREDVDVPGTRLAFRWHGHMHLHNRDMMRRVGLFPPKPDGVFRILVVGDSLTYGYGIAAEDTYVSLLDEALGPDVEVLNLGVSGAQSEDIAETVRLQFEMRECAQVRGLDPELQARATSGPVRMCKRFDLSPDLIVYGVCLNDFLPSGVGQTTRTEGWQLPIPGKRWLLEHSHAVRLLAERYDVALVKIGLRRDFFEEVLAGGAAYQERFGEDVRRMNEVVLRHGLPPVVGMVLHQSPGLSQHLVEAAEREMAEAGFDVVPATYTRTHAGQSFPVSRWEGHPNEEAHRMFADELLPALERHPALVEFRARGPVRSGSR